MSVIKERRMTRDPTAVARGRWDDRLVERPIRKRCQLADPNLVSWRLGPGAYLILSALYVCAVAKGDIASITGVYDSQTVLFEVIFMEPAPLADGWQFQLFVNDDGNERTGYWQGFDKLVRGVEFVQTGHVFLRHTLGGGGPGGWSDATSEVPDVRVVMVDDRHLEIEIALGVGGLTDGRFHYTFESYLDGRLQHAAHLQETVASAAEPDDDNDRILDPADNCPRRSNADQADGDGDGIGNVCDNCPDSDNENQTDTDSDGKGDPCDPCPLDEPDDTDDDGVCDSEDSCPGRDDTVDTDSDGVPDGCDNCPKDDNPGQEDADGDGVGDACQVNDSDGNGTREPGVPDICGSCGSGACVGTILALIGLPGLWLYMRRPRQRS